MQNHDEVAMHNLMRVHVLLVLLTAMAAGGVSGCVGAGHGTGGMDGGAGFTGGSGGSIGGDGGGGCFQCAPNCFDCGRGCIECMGVPDGSIGPDHDGGGIELPWTAPFANAGDDGTWRSTGDDTLCMGGRSMNALGVWSDERGVYVMGNGQFTERVLIDGDRGGADMGALPIFDAGFGGNGGVSGGGGGAGFGGSSGFGGAGGSGGFGGECFQGSFECSGRVIYFNDGVSGWRKEHSVVEASEGWSLRFSGVPLGELVLHRITSEFGTDCTLRLIEGGTERCDHSGSAVESFFAVGNQLAYASVEKNLLVYDGATWNVHPAEIPFVPTALWANTTDVVVVGDLGRIARLRDGVWTLQNHGIQQLTSVWGGDGDELWVGTGASDIMHRDSLGVWGESFSMRGVTCSRADAILGIWGADGIVYFHTDRALARWDGDSLSNLGGWTCALSDPNFGDNPRAIRNIWGNGPNELFIAISDTSRFADPSTDICGNGFVVYFDGTRFHRL